MLDCFLPNREVTGSVDFRAGVAVITGPDGAVLARGSDRRVPLHRSLFTQGAVPTEWLAADLPVSDEHRAGLTRALGADLAGYVLAAGLPAGGTATADAALDAAADVERLVSTDLAGRARHWLPRHVEPPGPPLPENEPTGITLIGDVEVGSLRSSAAAGGCEVPL